MKLSGTACVFAGQLVLVVYGPFNDGIRDVEAVQALAAQVGLRAVGDAAMPANNRCLVWRRA